MPTSSSCGWRILHWCSPVAFETPSGGCVYLTVSCMCVQEHMCGGQRAACRSQGSCFHRVSSREPAPANWQQVLCLLSPNSAASRALLLPCIHKPMRHRDTTVRQRESHSLHGLCSAVCDPSRRAIGIRFLQIKSLCLLACSESFSQAQCSL